MLSPRKHYVTPEMRSADMGSVAGPFGGNVKADFEGLSPQEAARLFSDLIKAQV